MLKQPIRNSHGRCKIFQPPSKIKINLENVPTPNTELKKKIEQHKSLNTKHVGHKILNTYNIFGAPCRTQTGTALDRPRQLPIEKSWWQVSCIRQETTHSHAHEDETDGMFGPSRDFRRSDKGLTPKLTCNTSLKQMYLFSELPVAYSQKHGDPSLRLSQQQRRRKSNNYDTWK
jgi:hypothetical protein